MPLCPKKISTYTLTTYFVHCCRENCISFKCSSTFGYRLISEIIKKVALKTAGTFAYSCNITSLYIERTSVRNLLATRSGVVCTHLRHSPFPYPPSLVLLLYLRLILHLSISLSARAYIRYSPTREPRRGGGILATDRARKTRPIKSMNMLSRFSLSRYLALLQNTNQDINQYAYGSESRPGGGGDGTRRYASASPFSPLSLPRDRYGSCS